MTSLFVSSALSGASEPSPEEGDMSCLLQHNAVHRARSMIHHVHEEDGAQEQMVVSSKITSFAALEVRQANSGHKTFYLNNATQSSTEDEHKYHELLVQPALAYLQHNSSVLVIGGGEGATLREVLTSPKVSEVTMVELDGELVQFTKDNLPEMHQGAFDSPKVTVLIEEGAHYLRDQDQAFDVIIVDGTDAMDHKPDAMDHMPRRDFGGHLFRQGFYDDAYAALRPGGSFVQYASTASPWPSMQEAGFVSVAGYEIAVQSLDGGGAVFAYGRKPDSKVAAEPVAEAAEAADAMELPNAISHMQTSQAFRYLNSQTMQQALSLWNSQKQDPDDRDGDGGVSASGRSKAP